MNIVLIVLGILAGLIVLFIIYRFQKVSAQNRKINRLRLDRVRPLYDKLTSGQSADPGDVLPYAENVLTRRLTFSMLNSLNKKELFPEEYYTLIKAAESEMANWLEFPTELNACPDELEHVKRVSIDFDGEAHFSHYEVFKFRVNKPHWAAKLGWMLGVVGPYFDDSEPYMSNETSFSRMDAEGKRTPEEEARWVHEHIAMRLWKSP
ncbi:MAG TPA: hypothetical protein VNW04_07165 [Puia sp.]|jgi:hypothetical protein|nr:hypothetical protein [Puia sp.]